MDLTYWNRFRAHPNNLPEHKPGIYRIMHLESERSYIGISRNIAQRLYAHATRNSPTKIKTALAKYGREGFLVEPLYYLTDKRDLSVLVAFERELMTDYDALQNGFNLSEGSPPFGGAYGAEFRELCRVAQNRPETKAKRAATMARPEVHARRIAAIRASVPKMIASLRLYFTDENARKANAERQVEAQSRPEVIAKKSAAAKANYQDPAHRAKHDAYFADQKLQQIRVKKLTDAMQRPDVVQKMRNRLARNATGVKGVYRFNGQFRAQITVNKKYIHLGVFLTIPEAEAAYLAARQKYFGTE